MAEYHPVDIECDINRFSDYLDRQCSNGEWAVISSNAYTHDGAIHFYALLEKVETTDYKGRLIGLVDSIDSNTSSIEGNTR